MGMTATVVGASGYAGGEVLRLLLGHPDLEPGLLAAGGSAGKDIGEVHPHLPELAGRQFADQDAVVEAAAAGDAGEVVFLALPHGRSAPVAAALPAGTRVVDLGADHRIVDPQVWADTYGGEHAGAWPYGLPELPGMRDVLRSATQAAAPGCYPTAVVLGLSPLLAAGLVEPADVVVVAASGTSGAGRAASTTYLGSEVMGDVAAYKVANHRHRPEMVQALSAAAGETVTVNFTPVLAPMPRGILATCTARLRPGTSEDELRDTLAAAYTGEPFVHLLPAGRWPHTAATLGSNAAQLQVTADVAAGRAVVVAAIDNLVKGAAGQAIQCANLMLGLREGAGLTSAGVAP